MPQRKTKTDFEVMQEMSDANEDISMSNIFLSVAKCSQGAIVRMGIEDETAFDKLKNGGYTVALYIIKEAQFFNRKNQPPYKQK